MMAYFYLPYTQVAMMWMPWMYPYFAFFYRQPEADGKAPDKQHKTAQNESKNNGKKAEVSKPPSVSTANPTASKHHQSKQSSVSTVPKTVSDTPKPEVKKPAVETVNPINNEVKAVAETKPIQLSVQPSEIVPPPVAKNLPEIRQPEAEMVSTPTQGRENLKVARRLVNSMPIASPEDVDRLTLMRAKPLLKALGISQSVDGKKKKVAELRDEIKQKLSDFELV